MHLFPNIPECDTPYQVWLSVKSAQRPKIIKLTQHHNVILEAVRLTFDCRARADACRQVLRDCVDKHDISRPVPKAILSAAITGSIASHPNLTPADVTAICNFISEALQHKIHVVLKGQVRKIGDGPVLVWSVDGNFLAKLNTTQNVDEQVQRLIARQKSTQS